MHNQKAIDPEGQEREKKPAESHEGHDDTCRCKETSQMTPRELLKLMMRDLAFWKKAKEDKDGKAGLAQQPIKQAALSRQARKGSNEK